MQSDLDRFGHLLATHQKFSLLEKEAKIFQVAGLGFKNEFLKMILLERREVFN